MQPKHKEFKLIIFELVLLHESYEWTDSLQKSEFIMLEMINNTIVINYSYLSELIKLENKIIYATKAQGNQTNNFWICSFLWII
ncbi:MAG: hypothetical protein ACRDCH_01580 [Metamycoplasmataceae bacterium]